MRYATLSAAAVREARSRRIGRCARCHAPILAEEEHYGEGQAIVHGACGSQPPSPIGDLGPETKSVRAAPPARPAPPVRRIRRTTAPNRYPNRLTTSDF